MLFSSITFIFIFLPIVLILYKQVKSCYRNIVLVAASWIFYAWCSLDFLAILLLTILINWIGGVVIDASLGRKRHFYFILFLCINLGILGCFKYLAFFNISFNSLFSSNLTALGAAVPIGMSFYIFKAMSYIIDIYYKTAPVQFNFINFSLYLSMFQALLAGPIIKYHKFFEQLNNQERSNGTLILGIKRFISGLAKKVLIADVIGLIVSEVFRTPVADMTTYVLWGGAVGAAFQLYFDFSGYSDMAIGLGLMFGFKIPENFNYPFKARSIQEYWQRWHITMSEWFRDYLFFPLMKSAPIQLLSDIAKKFCGREISKKMRQYSTLICFWFLIGLWHGTNWSMIIGTGIIHAFYLIFADIFKPFAKILKGQLKINDSSVFWKTIQRLHTFLLLIISYVFFMSERVEYALDFILGMFNLSNSSPIYGFTHFFDRRIVITYGIATVCSFPLFKNWILSESKFTQIRILSYIWTIFLFLISLVSIVSLSYTAFLYFQF